MISTGVFEKKDLPILEKHKLTGMSNISNISDFFKVDIIDHNVVGPDDEKKLAAIESRYILSKIVDDEFFEEGFKHMSFKLFCFSRLINKF